MYRVDNDNQGKVLAHQFVELVKALHSTASKLKMSAMFKAYLDESADGQKDKVFCIAGWLGSLESWEKFIPPWHERIAREGIKSLHMSDCESRKQEFKDWTTERKNSLIEDLTAIIMGADIHPFAAGMMMEDYNQILMGDSRAKQEPYLNNPYFLVFSRVAGDICKSLANHPPTEEVIFICDMRTDINHKMADYFSTIKDKSKVPEHERMRSITFASREQEIPLQAADFLAYEIMKREFNARFETKDRDERRSLTAIRPKVDAAQVIFFNENFLKHLLSRLSSSRDFSSGSGLASGDRHQSPS